MSEGNYDVTECDKWSGQGECGGGTYEYKCSLIHHYTPQQVLYFSLICMIKYVVF